MINKSFQLVRTNPLLTTNVKFVVDSNYRMFLESFNTNLELSSIQYKHVQVYKNEFIENKIASFWKKMPKELSYDVKYDNDNQIIQSDFSKQVDTIYMAGVSYIEDQWHSEEFEYFAPLYIRKNYLPKSFIILRVDNPSSYGSELTNNSELNSVDKNNFSREIVDRWKCIKYFDMSYETNFGSWLYKNYLNNDRFPKAPFEYNPEKTEFSNWYGMDYVTGIYTQKPFYMEDQNELETPHFRFEQFITEGYRRSGLIFPNILNLKFLFDDTPATPNSLRKYSMNRYYGFYIENLDFVCALTSYVTPDVILGTVLINNIFMIQTGTTEESCVLEDFYNIYFSGDTKYVSINPFVETWYDTKEYYIFLDNTHILDRKKTISGLYAVKRTYQNNRWLYKIVSDEILDQYWNTDRINSKTVNIEYSNYNIVIPHNPYITNTTIITGSTKFEYLNASYYEESTIPLVSGRTYTIVSGGQPSVSDPFEVYEDDRPNTYYPYDTFTGYLLTTGQTFVFDHLPEFFYYRFNNCTLSWFDSESETEIITKEESFYIDKYKLNHTTTSNNSILIPTGNTNISFYGETSKSFKLNDVINIMNDVDHSFKATVNIYNSEDGLFNVSYISNNGTGTFNSWTIILVGGENNYMYGDLYLIKIDDKYHVIKHYEDNEIIELLMDSNGDDMRQYYIQSDYAINLNNKYVEYWINGKNSEYYKKTEVNTIGKIPTTFPVYRVKFSDIKDFDFERMDTGYSKFDYEKNEFVDTSEEKLTSFDYNEDSIPSPKRVGKYGSKSQGKIENVSSEYIADDSLYEIYSRGKQFSIALDNGVVEEVYDLNSIWRKNQSICKWGFVGSISHSDYPYKLNNNLEVGGIYNRTTDPFLTYPDIISKNMDYFYRLGNFYNSNGFVYYKNQTTNIQQEDFIIENIKRFDVKAYFDSNFDYFTFFFKNKEKYNDGNSIRNFDKYSIFNGGDDNVASSVLFKGLKIKIREVTSIIYEKREDSPTEQSIISIKNGIKNFNDYKFSIIFNDNYKMNDINSNFSILDQNLILDTQNNCINIIINEKFKNVLVIINTSFENTMIPLNNTDTYDEKIGIYEGVERNEDAISNYNPSLFTASNFIQSINDFNGEYGLDINYYCIREVDDSIYYGRTNIMDVSKSTMTNIPNWQFQHTPFMINVEYPIEIDLNNNCYWTDPYFVDSVIDDYVATSLSLDNSQSYKTKIYRYMGYYEPIFKDIELFKGGYFYYDLDVKTNRLDKPISSNPLIIGQSSVHSSQIPFIIKSVCDNLNDDHITCSIPARSPITYGNTMIFHFDFSVAIINFMNFYQINYPNSIISYKIQVHITRRSTTNDLSSYCKDNVVSLSFGDIKSTNYAKSSKWGQTSETIIYGDNSGDYWGLNLNLDQLNSFDVNLRSELYNNYVYEQKTYIENVYVVLSFSIDWSTQDEPIQDSIVDFSNGVTVLQDSSPGVEFFQASPYYVSGNPFSLYYDEETDTNMNNFFIITPPIESFYTSYYKTNILTTSFKFDFPNTGSTSVIIFKGVEIKIVRKSYADTSNIYSRDFSVRLINDSKLYKDRPSSGNWETNYKEIVYGGPNDKWLNDNIGDGSHYGDVIETISDLDNLKLEMQIQMKNSSDPMVMFDIKCIQSIIYYEMNDRQYTYSNMLFYDNNYKFDTELTNFGKINELIYSKVNENKDFLKNMYEKYLIFPIIDEYGYDYSSKFIFKSSWDKEFFTRTKSTYVKLD